MIRRLNRRIRASQRGAAAIEFAMLFLIFFSVFYALVSYAMAMLLIQAFNHAAAEGARSVVKLNPLAFKSQGAYQGAVAQLAGTTVRSALDWLPDKARARLQTASAVRITFPVVNMTVPLGTGKSSLTTATAVKVDVIYQDYTKDPLVPFLVIYGIGRVPALPDDLIGSASLQL